jgi:diacylglycerol kinase family enzyme
MLDTPATSRLRPSPGRRLVAVVALAALVVSLGVAARLVLSFGWLMFVLASVGFVAVSVWYALTRRGVLRIVALAGVGVGVLAVAVVGIPLFVVVFVPLMLFGAAGRYALGGDTQVLLTGVRPACEVSPAAHGVLLINPKSGGGKAMLLDLAGAARSRGVRPLVLQPDGDLVHLAEEAVAAGADVIGMAGGDGSQALIAAVAMRHGIAFVCVPSGTRNHFALDLGLDRRNVIGALDAFTDGVERRVDLGRVNDRIFVNNASLGVYAQVVQSDTYRNAKLGTWVQMLPGLLGPHASPFGLEFDGPHATRYAEAPLVLVSNNPYRVTAFRGTATRPRLDSGCLGIVVARARRAVVDLMSLQSARRSRRTGGLIGWTQPSFEVRSDGAVPVGLDGESLLLDPPLRFTSLPAALRVRLPRHATGASYPGAGAAPTRADLIALLRVAAGRPIERAAGDPG